MSCLNWINVIVIMFGKVSLKKSTLNHEVWDFCSLKCGTEENVVCSKASSCPSYLLNINRIDCPDLQYTPINHEQEDAILDIINTYRNITAFGKLMGHKKNPTSSQMNAISYSKDLAFSAQCWANTCQKDKAAECLRTPEHQDAIQIVYSENREEPDWKTSKLYRIFLIWMGLTKNITRDYTKYHKDPFVNILWPSTKFVGCGWAHFQKVMTFICNFAPAPKGGTFLDGRKPCSNCSFCSSWYEGLCKADRDSLEHSKSTEDLSSSMKIIACKILFSFRFLIFAFF